MSQISSIGRYDTYIILSYIFILCILHCIYYTEHYQFLGIQTQWFISFTHWAVEVSFANILEKTDRTITEPHCVRNNVKIRVPLFVMLDSNILVYLTGFVVGLLICGGWHPWPCITAAIWRCQKPIRQWQCSFNLKAALPLVKRLATASDRSNNTGP